MEVSNNTSSLRFGWRSLILILTVVLLGMSVLSQPASAAELENGAEVESNSGLRSIVNPALTSFNTYEFYANGVKTSQQILANGEILFAPATPTPAAGQKFVGWFDEANQPVQFGAVSVAETKTIKITAQFENVFYVYFSSGGKVIATKEVVTPGTPTNANNVPIVPVDGKAFQYWSLTENGAAFDFSQNITADTTLYAVYADSWRLDFDAQGGLAVLPVYALDGQTATKPTTTRPGYTLAGWSLAPNGALFDFAQPITANQKLYAIWTPATANYTVVYWQENANDANYSYIESAARTGTTGTAATYANKFYTGFTYHHSDAVTISGDGTTLFNVYYSRNTYKLSFTKNGVDVITPVQVKHGAPTNAYWDQANAASNNQLRWFDPVGNMTNVEAPLMPTRDLTFSGEPVGNQSYTVIYIETPNNTVIKETVFKENYPGGVNYKGGRALEGFTWQYVNQPGTTQAFPVFNNATGRWEVKTYYKRNQYGITFYKNDNTGSTTVSGIAYQTDISDKALAGYEVGVTTRYDGFVFAGWYDNEALAGEVYDFAGKTMSAGNVSFYAKWNAPTHDAKVHITFTADGATQDLVVDHGAKLDESNVNALLGTPPAGATEFLGWFWYVNGTYAKFDFSMPIYNDIELFQEWKTGEYNVTYSAGEGSGSVSDATDYGLGSAAAVQGGTGLTAPAGKVFIGWLTNGQMYYPNQKITINGNVELVAQYAEAATAVSLTYHANGGTEADVTNNFSNNQLVTLSNNLFTRTGYSFTGWNTAADGSGTAYAAGAEVRINRDGNNDLYAQWKINQYNLTIKYVFSNNSQAAVDYAAVLDYQASYSVNSPVLVGYKADIMTAAGTMAAEDRTITVTYSKDETQTKKLTYRVEHWVDGVRKNYATTSKTVWVNDPDTLSVTAGSIAQKTYVGYKFDSMTPNVNAGDSVATGSVIKLIYIKDESQTKELGYTVEHVVDGVVKETETVVQTVWILDTQLAVTAESILAKTFVGYKFDTMTPGIVAGGLVDDETVIQLTYIKDETQTKKLTYTVEHIVNGVVKETEVVEVEVWINDPDTLAVTAVSISAKTYEKTVFDHIEPADIKAGDEVESGAVIQLHYKEFEPGKGDGDGGIKAPSTGFKAAELSWLWLVSGSSFLTAGLILAIRASKQN